LQESKGAWIMRMLHTQMGDDAFFAMTREFVEQYKAKSANTWDFKRLAEKHMNPAMDISRDGKLDWFFDSWVFGAPIPTYSLEYKVEPEGSGFAVSGKITQSGVPDDFLMSVPVHADGQLLGRVTVSADDGEFRFASSARPQRVELDPETTVLAVISR
jgi:aminopeptidase N